MICTAPVVTDVATGVCEPPLAEVPAGVLACPRGLGDGLPLCSTGRSLSLSLFSSTTGGTAGAEGGAGAGLEAAGGAGLEAAGGPACGPVCAGVVCAGVVCSGVAGGVGSDGLGFSEPERRNTGGASRSSAGDFDGGVFFFAAAAAIALADCQVPSPSHAFLDCSAPVTVNNP